MFYFSLLQFPTSQKKYKLSQKLLKIQINEVLFALFSHKSMVFISVTHANIPGDRDAETSSTRGTYQAAGRSQDLPSHGKSCPRPHILGPGPGQGSAAHSPWSQWCFRVGGRPTHK